MNTNRIIQTTLVVSSLLCAGVLRAADAPKLETTKDKAGYAIGMDLGMRIKGAGFDIEYATIAAGLSDALAGKPLAIAQKDASAIIQQYQQELRAKGREAGKAFLEANAKKDGVKTTASGLQYKIITEGTGEIPKTNHKVSTHYRGTTISGAEFDSSYKKGEPISFDVTGVIKGWTEALLMMPVGSKWQLFIPADLAYGDQHRSELITPGSALIFEMELISTTAPKPPEPIVSDIIKVPSAEEMKKGAKIETIKAEDVDKHKGHNH